MSGSLTLWRVRDNFTLMDIVVCVIITNLICFDERVKPICLTKVKFSHATYSFPDNSDSSLQLLHISLKVFQIIIYHHFRSTKVSSRMRIR